MKIGCRNEHLSVLCECVWSVYRVEPTALLSYMKNVIIKYTIASTGKIKSWSYPKLFKYINISLTVTDAQYYFFTPE